MYIPKNKIITNLYTNGLQINNPEGEKYFYIINTDIIYEGYYWKDYKGKFYTGKTPNDKPTQQLIQNPVNKDGNNTSYGLQVTLTSTDEFDFNAGASTNLTTTVDLNDDNWHNVVFTDDQSRFRIYIDGIEDNDRSSIPESSIVNSTSFMIGQSGLGSSFFPGRLSNIKIYHKALSATEILQNYNALKGRFGL